MPPFEPEQLPPKDLDLLVLFPLVGKANRAIATLEGLFYGIPNPNVLLSPITTQEAVFSSKIEGTQADFEDVLKFEAGEAPAEPSRREDIHEIMNYRQALKTSENLLKERTTQNWIGTEGTPIEQAVFVPPSPLHLQDHLNCWEAYWHSDAPDALVQLSPENQREFLFKRLPLDA